MNKSQIEVGALYAAKVSGQIVPVRVIAENPLGGWQAVNTLTGRTVHIRGAKRLRYPLCGKGQAKKIS